MLWRRSPLDDALLDRFDHHTGRADEFDGRLHVRLGAGEQDRHDAHLVLHAGLADVEHDLGELAAHLPDDRLLDRLAGAEGEPATAGVGHNIRPWSLVIAKDQPPRTLTIALLRSPGRS